MTVFRERYCTTDSEEGGDGQKIEVGRATSYSIVLKEESEKQQAAVQR